MHSQTSVLLCLEYLPESYKMFLWNYLPRNVSFLVVVFQPILGKSGTMWSLKKCEWNSVSFMEGRNRLSKGLHSLSTSLMTMWCKRSDVPPKPRQDITKIWASVSSPENNFKNGVFTLGMFKIQSWIWILQHQAISTKKWPHCMISWISRTLHHFPSNMCSANSLAGRTSPFVQIWCTVDVFWTY